MRICADLDPKHWHVHYICTIPYGTTPYRFANKLSRYVTWYYGTWVSSKFGGTGTVPDKRGEKKCLDFLLVRHL